MQKRTDFGIVFIEIEKLDEPNKNDPIGALNWMRDLGWILRNNGWTKSEYKNALQEKSRECDLVLDQIVKEEIDEIEQEINGR